MKQDVLAAVSDEGLAKAVRYSTDFGRLKETSADSLDRMMSDISKALGHAVSMKLSRSGEESMHRIVIENNDRTATAENVKLLLQFPITSFMIQRPGADDIIRESNDRTKYVLEVGNMQPHEVATVTIWSRHQPFDVFLKTIRLTAKNGTGRVSVLKLLGGRAQAIEMFIELMWPLLMFYGLIVVVALIYAFLTK
jgi:hypothetical protein